jgi:hypothetical protein
MVPGMNFAWETVITADFYSSCAANNLIGLVTVSLKESLAKCAPTCWIVWETVSV